VDRLRRAVHVFAKCSHQPLPSERAAKKKTHGKSKAYFAKEFQAGRKVTVEGGGRICGGKLETGMKKKPGSITNHKTNRIGFIRGA